MSKLFRFFDLVIAGCWWQTAINWYLDRLAHDDPSFGFDVFSYTMTAVFFALAAHFTLKAAFAESVEEAT